MVLKLLVTFLETWPSTLMAAPDIFSSTELVLSANLLGFLSRCRRAVVNVTTVPRNVRLLAPREQEVRTRGHAGFANTTADCFLSACYASSSSSTAQRVCGVRLFRLPSRWILEMHCMYNPNFIPSPSESESLGGEPKNDTVVKSERSLTSA